MWWASSCTFLPYAVGDIVVACHSVLIVDVVSIDAVHDSVSVKGESGGSLSTLVNFSNVLLTSVLVCLSVVLILSISVCIIFSVFLDVLV